MRRTEAEITEETRANALCVPRRKLPELLGCGLYTADKIARDSGARIVVGKRVLVYLPKLEEYLAQMVQ